MSSLIALGTASRRGALAIQREIPEVIHDELTQGSTAITLENHESDLEDPTVTGPSWIRHPSSGSSLTIQNNKVYNSSGSLTTLYYHAQQLTTVDYRVTGEFVIISNASGNASGVTAHMDAAQNTMYVADITPTATPTFLVRLRKVSAGTSTTLSSYTYYASSVPTLGALFKVILSVSNDEKVVYVQGPNETYPKRVCSSGDNSIPSIGYAGIAMIRSNNVTGQHLNWFAVQENGPQDPSGVTVGSTPDPNQSPALLWAPDYSSATLTVASGNTGPWYREQEPYVRGTKQTDRIQIVTGTDIPGTGSNKPTTGALRVTLNSFHNNDLTFHTTASAAAGDTSITMSGSDAAQLFDKDFLTNMTTGEILRVSGTPSGTTVNVLRGQSTTAAAIATTDDLVVPCGDVSDSGSNYMASRAEVYDRFAKNPDGSPASGTTPTGWPDPVGSVRWYGISIYIPSDFTTDTSLWFTSMQWKGQYGGSPPRALEIDGTDFIFGGTRSRRNLGNISKGSWTRFVFGFRWETDSVNGWSTVYKNGSLIVPKQYEATMDKHSGGADPIYLKDGIYRTKAWTVTHTTHMGPIKVGTTMADVFNP